MITENVLPWLALIIGGYFLGSIMFCRVICLTFFKTDICKVSKDGNPGAANAFWYCGKIAGISGLLLDMLKGFLPTFIAIKYLDVDNPLFGLVMFAPVLGHAFSIYHNFSGGKCIGTIYGVLTALFLTWTSPYLLIVLGVFNLFFELLLKSVPGDRRAYIMFTFLILASMLVGNYADQGAIMLGGILMSLLAIIKHSPLFAKTEEKKSRRKVSVSK